MHMSFSLLIHTFVALIAIALWIDWFSRLVGGPGLPLDYKFLVGVLLLSYSAQMTLWFKRRSSTTL